MEAPFIVDTLMATFGFGAWVVHEKLFCSENSFNLNHCLDHRPC
jgi:hypothetical protein